LLINGVGLRNFRTVEELQLETRAFRKAPGVRPVACRKALVKWLGLEYPTRELISVTERFASASNSWARLVRMLAR